MINPKYEYLREYVERIPKDFETIGTVIHSGRNLIKMITVDGLDINVKRYIDTSADKPDRLCFLSPFERETGFCLSGETVGERV